MTSSSPVAAQATPDAPGTGRPGRKVHSPQDVYEDLTISVASCRPRGERQARILGQALRQGRGTACGFESIGRSGAPYHDVPGALLLLGKILRRIPSPASLLLLRTRKA